MAPPQQPFPFIEVGHVIRTARLEKGITQSELARVTGISRRHISALERGTNVSLLILLRVTDALELVVRVGDVSVTPSLASAGSR